MLTLSFKDLGVSATKNLPNWAGFFVAVGLFGGSLRSVPTAPAYPSTSSGTTAATTIPHAKTNDFKN